MCSFESSFRSIRATEPDSNDLLPASRQEGYWAFSLGKAQEGALKKYIANQREHHKKEDFKTEIIRLLREEEIEFDERYLFD